MKPGAATEPGDMLYQAGMALLRLGAIVALEAGDLRQAHAWLAAHDRWLRSLDETPRSDHDEACATE